MRIVLPQLQSRRDFFAKAVKKSHFSGGFGLALKRRENAVWEHHNTQNTNESGITFPIYKQKAVTHEKSLICFLREDYFK